METVQDEVLVEQQQPPGGAYQLTLQVTNEQESAMDAFFQINSWQLVKGIYQFQYADGGELGDTHLMTVNVTAEQEAAIEAFFQINNWMFVKHGEIQSPDFDQGDLIEVNELEEEKTEEILDNSLGTLVEEVQGLQEVTATGPNGQVFTVYTEAANATGIPQSLLEGGGEKEGSSMPQVIIQEITLPEGMSLDQGLVISNPRPSTIRVTPRGTVKPGDKIHRCHVCGKTFKQAQSFNGHYQSHFGAKPYQCEICNTGFTLKAALVAHHSIHTGVKPYSCGLCNKGFRRKDDMMSHVRTHTGEKPYECDICGKKFKYRNQIPKHRRAHTGEKPYCCSTCDKSFTSNIHLQRHRRTHTGERPYKCTMCPKAFTQTGHLQAHMRIHTDERPFACSICGRGFREKKVMKKHEALHTAERKYKCEVCGKGFLRLSNLELHSVMHQKSKDGTQKVRPKPKKRRQADAEMREFVANVLSSVKKVDSGMQTETVVEEVAEEDVSSGVDNLSAFVNFAVKQSSDGNRLEPIEDQYTLVMQEDGSEGYLISNLDSNNSEEIVSMPSQQVEISSGINITRGDVAKTVVYQDVGQVPGAGNQTEVIGKSETEEGVETEVIEHGEVEERLEPGVVEAKLEPEVIEQAVVEAIESEVIVKVEEVEPVTNVLEIVTEAMTA